jgi:hypothetical protein
MFAKMNLRMRHDGKAKNCMRDVIGLAKFT